MEEIKKLLERLEMDPDVRDALMSDMKTEVYQALNNGTWSPGGAMILERIFKRANEKIKVLDETIDEFSKYHPLG